MVVVGCCGDYMALANTRRSSDGRYYAMMDMLTTTQMPAKYVFTDECGHVERCSSQPEKPLKYARHTHKEYSRMNKATHRETFFPIFIFRLPTRFWQCHNHTSAHILRWRVELKRKRTSDHWQRHNKMKFQHRKKAQS